MPDTLSWPVIVALCTAGSGIASFVVATVRARAWFEKTVLETIDSGPGRRSITTIAAERQARIEDKLDALGRNMDNVATRLEHRIDNLQTQMTTQIGKLDAETRQLEIRLARIEHQGTR